MTHPTFVPAVPEFADRVRGSFARQGAMDTLGARLEEVAPGRVVIAFDWGDGVLDDFVVGHGAGRSLTARAFGVKCARQRPAGAQISKSW